ncbi:TipAS antibiotic-recognition domain-containing protein [Glycomyces sp. NPDC047010]|uniref:MerR family transcriptional regulator n=1 Tax=Glycomyces sp. NPDC047010 TaxID=3155023 RepID=UPI0033C5CB72
MDEWTTAQVARLAGTTARTLRHYDAIGLLAPAGTGPGGQRRYRRAELLRLQQILLLKRLGLGLGDINAVLDGDLDEAEALRRHAAQLAAEAERLARLAATVEATIRQLEGGRPMAPDTWFTGLDAPDTRAQAREAWAQQVVERAFTALQHLTPEQRRAVPAEMDRINAALAALRAEGRGPADAAVQDVVADHYRLVEAHWDSRPAPEAYRRLAALYTGDPRFRDPCEQVAEGHAAFLAAAMTRYADTRL